MKHIKLFEMMNSCFDKSDVSEIEEMLFEIIDKYNLNKIGTNDVINSYGFKHCMAQIGKR